MNTLSAQEVKNFIENKTKSTIVINVLPTSNYDACHIKGSINYPIDNPQNLEFFKQEIKKIDKNKETTIILYCAHNECPLSKRAYGIALEVVEADKENIYVYEGGIKEWREKGFPTEGTNC